VAENLSATLSHHANLVMSLQHSNDSMTDHKAKKNEEPASNRGSGSIAILLGPRAQHAWQEAGSPDPYCPGNIVNNTTRYMGVDLIFHPRKNQTAKFFVACVYAPYGELESTNPGIITKFYETIETHLLQLPSDTTPIIGGDLNASIDNFRMNTRYGRYGAAYKMVDLPLF
jgi:hypothetical protein